MVTSEQVSKLDFRERENRVRQLVKQSHDILKQAVAEHVFADGREVAATAILYSGGNDSTTLAHIFKKRADVAIHANTGIGIEKTREFVRQTCAQWGLPLIEEHPPPGSTYRELVLDQGFPGPAHHWKMYQRLKERCLRQARRKLVTNPRKERVVFLAGRRREESSRRSNVPISERDGSVVWVSPLVYWTKADLNTYRSMYAVPRNEVSDLLHMSGECLCGAFAHRGELEEIGYWFPDVKAEIEALECEVAATGKFPEKKCKWGWTTRDDIEAAPSKSGPMCSSCDARFDPGV